MLRVATWNVLHRIHAINWGEPIALAEPERIAAIAARVAASEVTVWCLQEVSGDQVVALRAALPDAQLHLLTYPRIPRLHRGPAGPAPLADPTEHLVTIVGAAAGPARVVRAAAFPTDPGKGLLAVELATGVIVINTHVTYGDKRDAQCAALGELARRAPGTVALLGDFNADRAVILAALDAGFIAVRPTEPALPTRPRAHPSDKPTTIDHVLVRNGGGGAAIVEDAHDLSDHNPTFASITPRSVS